MDTAITLKDAGMILIGAGVVILIAYCIAFMKNLTITIKHTNKILEDAQVISKIAANKSKDADKLLTDAAASVGSFVETVKGNQSKLAAFTSIINALASLKTFVKNG